MGSREQADIIRDAIKLERTETWLIRTLPDGRTEVKVLDSAGKAKDIDTSTILSNVNLSRGEQL
ncbi:MAG: hypothetical protein COA95_11480 [Methylophaga sp.]|nr:MAG: hypothetical protein COA95_11480 [Methylophaga sp.]